MKNFFFIIILIFSFHISIGQNFKQIANYEFQTTESYSTEKPKVLACANYLFENPADKNEINRLTSIQYIIKWMTGTPDYTFDIGDEASELTKGNSDLLGLYMAAMTKVVLENNGENLTSVEIYNQSEEILVNYCSNPDNKMKPSKKIKKIIKSKKG